MEKTSTSFAASNWQPIPGHGVFKGIFTVRMPGALTIHGISLFEKAGARWVSLPKRRHTDENGDFVWIPVVEIDDKVLLEAFCIEALEALEALLEQKDDDS